MHYLLLGLILLNSFQSYALDEVCLEESPLLHSKSNKIELGSTHGLLKVFGGNRYSNVPLQNYPLSLEPKCYKKEIMDSNMYKVEGRNIKRIFYKLHISDKEYIQFEERIFDIINNK
jgi:hypothetical protein